MWYLLDHGFVGPEAVVDGGLTIRDVSSRNCNFRVETHDGTCYLLKQGLTPDAVRTVAQEASVYQHLVGIGGALAACVPRFYGYDVDAGVLALELVPGAEDLRAFHLRTGQFSAGPAASLGRALGTLHRATATTTAVAPAAAPWILRVDRPGAQVFRDISAAGLELITVVQGAAGFPAALDRVREAWSLGALIHGDVKWDNCLVISRDDGREEIRLIDWETAAPGDPCWDIGSALSHYLSFWLYSIPVTGLVPPERFPELAAYPLDAMKSALAACWIAYVDARRLDDVTSRACLIHAVEFAGARLVLTAFEAAQLMQRLTSSLVLHLQLALNILSRPEDAASRLLGLAVAGAGAR